MIIQGNEIDFDPDELPPNWEEVLALLLESDLYDKVYIGARLFTKDVSGRWREICQ